MIWCQEIASQLVFADGFTRRVKQEPQKRDALAGYHLMVWTELWEGVKHSKHGLTSNIIIIQRPWPGLNPRPPAL